MEKPLDSPKLIEASVEYAKEHDFVIYRRRDESELMLIDHQKNLEVYDIQINIRVFWKFKSKEEDIWQRENYILVKNEALKDLIKRQEIEFETGELQRIQLACIVFYAVDYREISLDEMRKYTHRRVHIVEDPNIEYAYDIEYISLGEN